ncbi:MAG TPA: hypothetical protein VHK69_01110, partial [Chitinophagaceae bacterium]|nr:hypothetical protein [Chitinophagaceae bacterium]
MRFLLLLLTGCISGLLLAGCATQKAPETGGPVSRNPLPVAYSDSFLTNILAQYPSDFGPLLADSATWRIQILYTRIDRDPQGRPTFRHHGYGQDPGRYHYPASTVKLPVAALALQKLRELAVPGLDRNSIMITESGFSGQTSVYNDPSSADGSPSIGHYIKKILLVS